MKKLSYIFISLVLVSSISLGDSLNVNLENGQSETYTIKNSQTDDYTLSNNCSDSISALGTCKITISCNGKESDCNGKNVQIILTDSNGNVDGNELNIQMDNSGSHHYYWHYNKTSILNDNKTPLLYNAGTHSDAYSDCLKGKPAPECNGYVSIGYV
jgi:hypothetical protein